VPTADDDPRIRIHDQPEGNLELELWNDISAPVAGGFDQASTLQRIELEYGLTDHWDLALYHVFGQDRAPPFGSTPGAWRRGIACSSRTSCRST